MAELDLFDLVGMAFDPPETNARQIKKKIDAKKTELGASLGRESQQVKRDEIQSQISFLEKVEDTIFTPDGKKIVDAELRKLADKKISEQIRALTALVQLLKISGQTTVTSAAIRHHRKETRLSESNVKKVFTDSGFSVIDIDPLSAFPKFPTNADRIARELEALRKTKDPNPQGADTSGVTDLYAFAAYLKDETSNRAAYKAMVTKELWEIFDPASRRFSQRNDDLGKLLGSLSTAAKTYVFNSDENRDAYDKYLVYHSEELSKLFYTMDMASDSSLLSPKFADQCIKIIEQYFPDKEVALAIYNKEAGFEDTFYVPANWNYIIKCSYCDCVNEFPSEAEAIKINACTNCRKPLFKKCDKCSKMVPVGKEACPYCDFVFASVALFSKYFQQAEAALKKNDFNIARDYLFKAQSADPREKVRIENLKKQIDHEEEVKKEPINRIRNLINENKYSTAKSELGKILKKYPDLNMSEYEQVIRRELAKADQLYKSVENASSSRKADTCISILMQCTDYPQALTFLYSNAPEKCSGIYVNPEPKTGIVNISWERSGEQGVTYRLVRKTGKTGAASENDGNVLLDNSTATSFTDRNAKPGIAYTYSVFAVRMGVYSVPAAKSGTILADIKNGHISQRDLNVRLSWDAPENSRGATVIRICDGQTQTMSQAAYGSFEDNSVQYKKTYTYRISVNYDGGQKSPGYDMSITLLPSVDSFTIRYNKDKGNKIKLYWSIEQEGIPLRIMVNNNQVAEARTEDKTALISLPEGTACKISVQALSGGKWIAGSNTLDVFTYASCEIDKKATTLEESMISGSNGVSYRVDLKIRLSGNVPSDVTSFYYSVRTANSDKKWVTLDEIGSSSDLQMISCATYRQQGYMMYQDYIIGESSFYVSVFTVFNKGGQEIITGPHKVRIDRPLNANIFWSVSYGMFDGLKLNLEMSGNKPIDYIPELLLCVCDPDKFIISQNDNDAKIILKIPKDELGKATEKYSNTVAIKTDLPGRYLKKCKYFLFSQGALNGDNITLRWKQGFSGKV